MTIARAQNESALRAAIGYAPVPLSIRDHPEITFEYRTAKDADGLVERILDAGFTLVADPEEKRRYLVAEFWNKFSMPVYGNIAAIDVLVETLKPVKEVRSIRVFDFIDNEYVVKLNWTQLKELRK